MMMMMMMMITTTIIRQGEGREDKEQELDRWIGGEEGR